MFGGGSIQLGRVFGIRIGVDVSWFIVLFLIIWSLSGYYEDVAPGSNAFVLATVSALLFFLSILLHELGHALGGDRNGIPILGIDLWMFGGVAKLGATRTRPAWSSAWPLRAACTLAIAAACFGLGAAISGSDTVLESSRFENDLGATTSVLGYLMSINLLVLVFNLIPGFPLDGGRIARAIAWKLTGDRNKATRFAGVLGRPLRRSPAGRPCSSPARTRSPASGSRSSASSSPRRPNRRSSRRTSPTGSATSACPT